MRTIGTTVAMVRYTMGNPTVEIGETAMPRIWVAFAVFRGPVKSAAVAATVPV